MTTGLIVDDRRVYTTTGCGGMSRYGSYFRKSFSGSDSPDGSRRDEHPYSMSLESSLDSLIKWRFANGSDYHTGTPESCGFSPTHSWPAWDSNDELKLLTNASAKMRGHSFNAAVSLGEARESIRMIAETAKSLAESYMALRRGNIPRALKSLGLKPSRSTVKHVQEHARRSAANAWLGLTYGWTPLVSDAANAAEALAANVSGAQKATFHVSRRKLGSVYGSGGGFSAEGTAFRSVRLKLILRRKETLLDELGFGRPELVAWELFPFSHVADWFVPIGDYLEALTSFRGIEGTFVRSDFCFADARIGTSPFYVIREGVSTRKAIELTRTVGSISSLAVNIPAPKLRNPLSVSHALSAISLLQVVFGK